MSKRHGHGEQRYGVGTKDVSTYAGDWHENCRHGRGAMTYASGNVYEGVWVKVSRFFPQATGENRHLPTRLMRSRVSATYAADSLLTKGLLR